MPDNADNNNEVVTTLRLPSHIHKQMSELAKINRRSLNAQMVTAIENDIARTRLSGKKAS